MKAILITLLSLSFSTIACECADPNFNDSDIDLAVINFMDVRFDVAESEITSVEYSEKENFLTFFQKVTLSILGLREGKDSVVYKCEKACSEGVNEKVNAVVNFHMEGELCQLKLVVKLISDKDNFEDFKDIVKQKESVKCSAL